MAVASIDAGQYGVSLGLGCVNSGLILGFTHLLTHVLFTHYHLIASFGTIEIHLFAILEGDRLLVVDDLDRILGDIDRMSREKITIGPCAIGYDLYRWIPTFLARWRVRVPDVRDLSVLDADPISCFCCWHSSTPCDLLFTSF